MTIRFQRLWTVLRIRLPAPAVKPAIMKSGGEAREEIDKAQKELDDARAEADEELGDAPATLESSQKRAFEGRRKR